MTITFFGHANYHYGKETSDLLDEVLEREVGGRDVTFYMGLDGRFDWLAKNCCLRYKEKYGNAKLVFVTPYIDEAYLKNLEFAIKGFDEVLYPDLEKVPKRYAIVARNKFMIKNCDLAISFYKYVFSNSYKLSTYALGNGKREINLCE